MTKKTSKKKTKSKVKKRPVNVSSHRKLKTTSPSSSPSDDRKNSTNSEFPGGLDLYPENYAMPSTDQHFIADLHFHSVCSDGKFRPHQVVTFAAERGLKVISLTDHDTMVGVKEATDKAKTFDNLFVIPGVEVSAEARGESVHVLGYFAPGTETSDLDQKLEQIRNYRHVRGKTMLQKLKNMGIVLSWDRILEIAGEAAPGRPHVAEALVESGHVSSFRAAFDRYLHNDGPAYAAGAHFPPEEAVQMINDAGGISVLAHPWCCKNLSELLPSLVAAGLQGLEVYHDVNKIEVYAKLAKTHELMMSGGSDFHGIQPDKEMDIGGIPFSKKHLNTWLDRAKVQWKKALKRRIESVKEKLKSTTNASSSTKEEVLLWIWTEQLQDWTDIAIAHGLSIRALATEGVYTQMSLALKIEEEMEVKPLVVK